MKSVCLLCSTVALVGLSMPVSAAQVSFASATATYYQTAGRNWVPSDMIDGISNGGDNGWAIFRKNGAPDETLSETALFTTASPLAAGPTTYTFTIYQNYGSGHLLGDFSLGYTTATSPTLASGQTTLHLTSESSLNGTTFTSPAMGQLLAGGPLPETDVYTITASINSASPITGFFLNAINDSANGLPTGGPGRQPTNGNFVISEFAATATPITAGTVPEPASWALMLAGFGVVGGVMRRRATPVSVAA